MTAKLLWRTCHSCGSKYQVDAETYNKKPLIFFCPYCNMNKAGDEKDKGIQNKGGSHG